MTSPSVIFLDRDGTLIRDGHYLSDPGRVEMLGGAAEAVTRLNRANIPVVIVSNQSGIGRGYYSMEDYEIVRTRFEGLLEKAGASVQATYICPHSPEDHCNCRKPLRELFDRAIADYGFDPSRLVFIGDRWRDVDAHLFYPGARAALVPGEMTPAEERARGDTMQITFPDLKSALDSVLA